MNDKDDKDDKDEFVPYDHLTSKTRLLKSISELEQDTEEPETVEATSEAKARVSWTQRLLGWFRRK